MCACVGWRVCLPKVSSPLLTPSVPLSALSRIVSPHICLCWMVGLPSRRVVFPFCLRLSLHMCACDGMSAFSGLSLVCHCRPLSPHMCLCWMVCLPSRGLVSACLRLSPHNMRLCWMVCPPSQGLVSPCRLPSFPCLNGVPAFSRSCLPWSPIAPHSLPLSPRMCAPVLDGVSAFPTSCFRIVSHCPHMCACVGWCVRLPEVLSPLVSLLIYPCLRLSPRVSHCLPLSPVASNCLPTCACVGWSTFPKSWFSLPSIVSLDTCDLCCVVHPLSRGLVSPLSPIVSLLVSLCWMVCPPSRCFVSFVSFVSQLVFLLVSQLVSQLVFLLVSLCGGWSDFAFFQTVYCWGRLSQGVRLGVGWCVRLPEVLSPILSPIVPLLSCFAYPFLFPFVGWCVCLSEGLVSLCLPLYPFLFPFVGWCVLPFGGSCLPCASHCTPS